MAPVSKPWKNKTDLKLKVQDLIMDKISTCSYDAGDRIESYPKEIQDEFMQELKKQMDRIAKMFGFEEAWWG